MKGAKDGNLDARRGTPKLIRNSSKEMTTSLFSLLVY